VSFQTATHISPEAASGAVLGHEYEHVNNNKAQAAKDERRIISQTVTVQTACCPE